MKKISNNIALSSLITAALSLGVINCILPTNAIAQTEEAKNELKAERRIGFYLGSAFGQISALCDLVRDKKLTPNTAQDYLKAYRLSHKNERDEYGINIKEASEIGFNVGLKTSNSTNKEMNLNPCTLKIN